jgi:dephospho-CoA kinase
MKIIGLTGNAGSGKSTALDYFRSKGIDGISADAINADLRLHNQYLTIVIENTLQEKISDANGLIDTKRLRDIVFTSESSRTAIEMILHPIIMENIDLQLSLLPEKPYCIIEIPLLFEAKLLSLVDSILLVTSNRAELAERLRSRKQLSPVEIDTILDSQLADNNKFPFSDDIVLNNSTQEVFHKCLDQLHHRNSH